MTVARILFATAFVYFSCLAAGHLLFRAIGLRLWQRERRFLAFLAGVALVSSAVFALAVAHLVYTWIFAGLGLLVLLAWYFRARRPLAPAEPEPAALPLGWQLLFWLPYLIYAGLYVFTAMMPEVSPDGTIYHVGLITRYYEHRGFYAITTQMYAGLSAGVEMLFLVAFAFGRHSATAMVHLLFLLTLPFGMLAFATRMNVARAGVVGALLVFIAPVVGRDGTSAYVDVAAAAVIFGAFYFLEIWRTGSDPPALAMAGLLAGFAYAAKFTAAAIAVYGFIYILCVCRSRRLGWATTLRRLSIFSGLAALMAVPWIVKDIVQFQNPFYPFFNTLFPNPYQYPMVENAWRQYFTHMNGIKLAGIPYQATIGGRLDGILGPVFLLAPVALLSLRSKVGRALLLVFIPVLLPYFGNIGARFLISPLPFLALAMALGVLAMPRIGSALAVLLLLAHAVSSWPYFIAKMLPPNQWRIESARLAFVLRKVPESRYLEDRWPEYKAGLLLDRYVPPGERVFSPGLGQMAYQHREVLGTFDSVAGRRAWEALQAATDPIRATTWTRDFTFSPVRAEGLRVVTDSTNETDFCVNEMRFYKGSAELVRSPSWRLRASSFPWGLPLAFDNGPISFWTSGRKAQPGMWIGAQFGAPADADRILVTQIVDQRWIKTHAEVYVQGSWRNLNAHEDGVEHPPARDQRMLATDELKTMGIRWVLMPDSNTEADDMKKHAPYWGITQMGLANGYRLWRLD